MKGFSGLTLYLQQCTYSISAPTVENKVSIILFCRFFLFFYVPHYMCRIHFFFLSTNQTDVRRNEHNSRVFRRLERFPYQLSSTSHLVVRMVPWTIQFPSYLLYRLCDTHVTLLLSVESCSFRSSLYTWLGVQVMLMFVKLVSCPSTPYRSDRSFWSPRVSLTEAGDGVGVWRRSTYSCFFIFEHLRRC